MLKTKTDGKGQTISYIYDRLKRLREKQYPGGRKIRYTYTGETLGDFYRARYYAPDLGRFTKKDFLGLLGGINKFAYVKNNPIIYFAPLGLLTWDYDWNINFISLSEMAREHGNLLKGTYFGTRS